jgi:hypothetical protein
MKLSVKIGFLTLMLICSQIIMAQENTQTNNNFLHYYDAEIFQWNYDIFGGLSLNFHNQSSSAIFGINISMKNALKLYPDSSQQFSSYKLKNTTGNILLWGGLVALVGGTYMPLFLDTSDYDNFERNVKISAGLMLGGLVSELVGTFIFSSGKENLFNAVNIYNRHRIEDYK